MILEVQITCKIQLTIYEMQLKGKNKNPFRDQLNANGRKISKFTGSINNKSYNTKPKLKTKLARLRLSTISPLLDICTDLIKIEARKMAILTLITILPTI